MQLSGFERYGRRIAFDQEVAYRGRLTAERYRAKL
jgi:hypothetical protein